MGRGDQFRFLAGLLVCASGVIFYLAFVQPAPPSVDFAWSPPDDAAYESPTDRDSAALEDLSEVVSLSSERTQFDSRALLMLSSRSVAGSDTAVSFVGSAASSNPAASGGGTISSIRNSAGLFAATDPDLARRVSRAVAEGRYEAAADLVVRSPEGRRVAHENSMSEDEFRGILAQGFAYVARDREISSLEAEVDRIMIDPRSGALIRSVGLSEGDVEYLVRELLARKEAYGSAPGNPRPIDYGPRDVSPR